MFDQADADEIVPEGEDVEMDSDDEGDEPLEEIALQNDSSAHFDAHKDSIFCIAQHPLNPAIVATGGGDDVAYIWDATPAPRPVLPASYEADPQPIERQSLQPLLKLEGHSDSVNAIAFSLPDGAFAITAGLDGRINVFGTPGGPSSGRGQIATAQEVEEINWLASCPHPNYPNTFAIGASDGSVWVYTINASDSSSPLSIVQAFYNHTGPCTAGAWTPDGKLLATVSEDSSLYVWDVFGEAAAAGLSDPSSGQAVVGLTASDERFRVEGGLYSVAVSPGGAIVAVGGAEGHIRVVGLPRLSASGASGSTQGAGAKAKAAGGKQAPAKGAAASAGQAGTILASLQAQSDGVETLAFAQPPLTLLAAGSVDGSVALFDVAHNFAVRRHIRDAHEEEAVIKVDFVRSQQRGWLLTTVGNDGVVRRWDVRGGTAAAQQGFAGEWRGHRGGGEGGGILGFVQGQDGKHIVTAGDDGVSLVFETA
ncbi:WD40 repeat-like protein [Myriangium duriaei CBS 260.36]|uniref:WD40 repeat-like protein n=1 Tax=Myriangium duriaei CBS 260.36 TaxID=1168546 RepID=A0A9P4J4B8_9PEZI|nr:WD40 repeat-like protein [Myriangium duriaei CBS 260.36]